MGPLQELHHTASDPALATEAAFFQSAEMVLHRSKGDSFGGPLTTSALGSPKSPQSKHALEIQLKEMAAREQLALSSLEGARREAARSLEMALVDAKTKEDAAVAAVRLETKAMLQDTEARAEAKLREAQRQLETEKAAMMNASEHTQSQNKQIEELQERLTQAQAESGGFRNALERTQALCKNYIESAKFTQADRRMQEVIDDMTSEVIAKTKKISHLETELRVVQQTKALVDSDLKSISMEKDEVSHGVRVSTGLCGSFRLSCNAKEAG